MKLRVRRLRLIWAGAFALAIANAPLAALAAEPCYRPGLDPSPLAKLSYAVESQPGLRPDAADFQPAPAKFLNFGFTDSAYWFRLCVKNPGAAERFHLALWNPFLEHIAAFRDGQAVTRFGLQDPGARRGASYDFELARDQSAQLEFRIGSRSPVRFTPTVLNQQDHVRRLMAETALLGALLGAQFGLSLYNLFLFFQIRERGHGLLALCLWFTVGYRLFFHGFPVDALNDALRAHYLAATLLFGLAALITAFAWLDEFLFLRRARPRAYVANRVWQVLALSLILLTFVDAFLTNRFITFVAAAAGIYMAGLTLYIWRRSANRHLLWLFVGLLATPILMVTHALAGFGMIPFNLPVRIGLDAAALIQALFLSIAHSDRIREFAARDQEELERLVELRTRKLHAEIQLRREAQQRAETAAKLREDILANISHEIRTPMNAVLGMAELLEDTPLSAEQQHFVRTFRNAGGALMHILNDVLDLSRIEAGQIELAPEVFDLHDLLQTTAAAFLPEAQRRHLNLRVSIAGSAPRYVLGDKYRISQILGNLLSNALKFTDQGGAVLSAQGAPEGVRIAVRDTGPGIPAAQIEEIFHRFHQADASYSKRRAGSGLGLAISRRLAEAMQGRLYALSEPGQGSEFIFEAPLKETAPPHAPAPQNPVATHAEPQRLRRILAVDDSPDNRELVMRFLRDAPCDVVLADSGAAALDAFEKGEFDLILMDIQMSELDGFQTTERIRERAQHAGRRTPPIIALTAYATERERKAIEAFGFDGYLAKPFSRRALQDAISSAPFPPAPDAASAET